MKGINAGLSSSVIEVIDLTEEDDDKPCCTPPPLDGKPPLDTSPLSREQSGWLTVTTPQSTAASSSSTHFNWPHNSSAQVAEQISSQNNLAQKVSHFNTIKRSVLNQKKWINKKLFALKNIALPQKLATEQPQNSSDPKPLPIFIPLPEKNPPKKKHRARKSMRKKKPGELLQRLKMKATSFPRTMTQENMAAPPQDTGNSVIPLPNMPLTGSEDPDCVPVFDGTFPLTIPSSSTNHMSSGLMPGEPSGFLPLHKLRPIVIDGIDVATNHAHPKKAFSPRGIVLCVNFFRARGHTDIVVFLPHSVMRNRFWLPMLDVPVLRELEKNNLVQYVPSRLVDGTLVQCCQDSFILELASRNGGVVVSNKEYEEATRDRPQLQQVVTGQVLGYCMVQDHFMPAPDPLGRFGPKLDQFLIFPTPGS